MILWFKYILCVCACVRACVCACVCVYHIIIMIVLLSPAHSRKLTAVEEDTYDASCKLKTYPRLIQPYLYCCGKHTVRPFIRANHPGARLQYRGDHKQLIFLLPFSSCAFLSSAMYWYFSMRAPPNVITACVCVCVCVAPFE